MLVAMSSPVFCASHMEREEQIEKFEKSGRVPVEEGA